ncbi:hypothetical protein [Enterococcus sp. BWR-S5]|uniref:hypothetical protein n=1 Tax=Enterococcus sp. BWR-S5 TaxID=2787714 RepID=UPI001920FEDF|nr:hypothetical protein [Enterococcus sp. BWR-S5]MBL1225995.1 hypothetical protein [Enterococcus sp. BWR-S5]
MNKIVNLVLAGVTGVIVGVGGTYLVMTSFARGEQLPKTGVTSNSYKELKLDDTMSSGKPVEATFKAGDFGEDRGAGTFDLSNESGTTANGVVPVVYAIGSTITQLKLDVTDFNGALLTFVYLDGKEIATNQWGNSSATIDLTDGNGGLAEGIHTIQLVQYTENNPELNPVLVKSQLYEVK